MQYGFQPNFETHITFSMVVEYSVFWVKNELPFCKIAHSQSTQNFLVLSGS